MKFQAALLDQVGQGQVRRLDMVEAVAEAGEYIAGEIADHAGVVALFFQNLDQGRQLQFQFFGSGEHMAHLVVGGKSRGEDRGEGRERPGQRRLGVEKIGAARQQPVDVGRGPEIAVAGKVVGPQRVGAQNQDVGAPAGALRFNGCGLEGKYEERDQGDDGQAVRQAFFSPGHGQNGQRKNGVDGPQGQQVGDEYLHVF
jgi:hypothetical protein